MWLKLNHVIKRSVVNPGISTLKIRIVTNGMALKVAWQITHNISEPDFRSYPCQKQRKQENI